MALCISKRSRAEEECEDVCKRQADSLDELLSTKLMGAERLEDLVCSEEDFLRAEPDEEGSTTGRGEKGTVSHEELAVKRLVPKMVQWQR